MRIAIFDPHPRVCGVTQFGRNMQAGFRALGHHCDVVTFTKRGNSRAIWGDEAVRRYSDDRFSDVGVLWWPIASEVYESWKHAVSVLDSYDMILLVEPKCPPLDKVAENECEEPPYIDALRRTKTPWISFVHGPHYDYKQAPFLKELMAAGCRGLMYNVKWHQDLFPLRHANEVIVETVPYAPRWAVNDSYCVGPTIGYVGRLVPNKGLVGLVLLAELVADIDDCIPWEVHLHGSTSVAPGPCFTYQLMELLQNRGYGGEIYLPEKVHQRVSATGKNPTIKPHPWVMSRGNLTVRYHGGYIDVHDVLRNLACTVELTSWEFQHDMVELAGLESIDAGCLTVLPAHQVSDEYGCLRMHHYKRQPKACYEKGTALVWSNEEADEYAEIAHEIYTLARGRSSERVRAGREALRKYHDPSRHARMALELAL